jgi:hypothetical protein
MRTMCEIISLFVDRKINTQDDVAALLDAEAATTDRKSIAETATRLLPHSQAERILNLLKEGTD